jgi:hypothetical protein
MSDETFDYPTMARALIIGDKDTVARKTHDRPEGAHLQGAHPGDGRGGREVPPE